MKTLYFECNNGASGDMIISVLFDLIDDKDAVINDIKNMNIPDTEILFEKNSSYSVSAVSTKVIYKGAEETESTEHHQTERNLDDIFNIIDFLNTSEKIKADAKNIYTIIANAESRVHGREAAEIHFHELGTMDAIADTVICSYLFDKIGADRVCASSINVGNGVVKCAHGKLPVPAPATVEILKEIPYYKSDIYCELCTPTGSAVLKYFCNEFSDCFAFNNRKIGYGMGKKDIGRANILRAFLSEQNLTEIISQLEFNVDDMTAEEISYACEILLSSGAKDVYCESIYMKKGRIGTKITVLCDKGESEKFARLIFKHTTTIGIREYSPYRYVLERKIESRDTPFGEVKVKRSFGFGAEREKTELESLKSIAQSNDISLFDARKIIDNFGK